jgi:hypothetical protein
MALTDSKPPGPAFDPVRAIAPTPYDALSQLPRLHGEASRNLLLTVFLGRSPQACVTLMLAGTAMLVLGGGSLKAEFAWAVLVLLGIIAMTRNYIRGFARSLRRVPLQEAASDLRTLLLYTGAAWGSGAFLVMPGLPAPALVFGFAALPAFALALILKDKKGVAAFTAPVALITAGASVLGAWPMDVWVSAAVLAASTGIVFLSALQQTRPPVLAAPALR